MHRKVNWRSFLLYCKMMKNSDYLLQSMDEIKDLLEVPGFFEYAWPVYCYLETMKPGTIIKLMAPPERLPWLIKTVHLFLSSGNHRFEYEFNDDLTKFRRLEIPPPKRPKR